MTFPERTEKENEPVVGKKKKKRKNPAAINVIVLKNSGALKALNNLHIQFIQ